MFLAHINQISDNGWRWLFDNSKHILCNWFSPEHLMITFHVWLNNEETVFHESDLRHRSITYKSFEEASRDINHIRVRLGYEPIKFPRKPKPPVYKSVKDATKDPSMH